MKVIMANQSQMDPLLLLCGSLDTPVEVLACTDRGSYNIDGAFV